MYIDLDLHFSDGVSEAFASTSHSQSPSVLTLSLHHSSPGFFPASLLADLTPLDTPNPFSLSIPLSQGASNATFLRMWRNCVEPVRKTFRPDFVVLQCGVDGLAGDPNAVWNWGLNAEHEGSLGWCVKQCVEWGPKVMLLGGGGYHSANAARAWSYLTTVACGTALPMDTAIPDHKAFPIYAPSFTLEVAPGNMQDQNSEEGLRLVEERLRELADRLRSSCV